MQKAGVLSEDGPYVYLRESALSCFILTFATSVNSLPSAVSAFLSTAHRVDRWITKGGKSMRAIMQEVTALQEDLDAAGSGP